MRFIFRGFADMVQREIIKIQSILGVKDARQARQNLDSFREESYQRDFSAVTFGSYTRRLSRQPDLIIRAKQPTYIMQIN
jgi:hypothetical protein